MQKSADAFRTISEVADDLSLPQHVLRFWETRFPQIRPLKRAGGRRYYRPNDIVLLRAIRQLLYDDGYTIKGVQRLLKEQGPKGLADAPRPTLEVVGEVPQFSHGPETETSSPSMDRERDQVITTLASAHRTDLEASLALVEECKRILDALRQ